jgi:tetratricopeptide (TPR) repeat protein
MDSTPPTDKTLPPTAPGATGRKIQWVALVVLLVTPLVWLGGGAITALVCTYFSFGSGTDEWLMFGLPGIVAVAVVVFLARVGLRRGWHRRKVLLGGWSLVALGVLTMVFVAIPAYRKVRRSSIEKSVLCNLGQLSAAADQFVQEAGAYRLFITRDELIGPDRYLKAQQPAAGEDYTALYPIRQDQAQTLPVVLPDGRKSERTEVLTVTLPDGGTVSYPRPDDVEGKKQDGVHTLRFPDGRSYQITYRGGVPDGPFRAYFPDGVLWGEATYARGRVVGPCWLHTRDGRKFNELAEGEKAAAAVAGSAAAAMQAFKAEAWRKQQARDFAGAIAALNRAMAVNPADTQLLYLRGLAKQGLGELDGAINDYCAGLGIGPDQTSSLRLPDYLKNALSERIRLRRAAQDPAGAAADFRGIAQTALWNAEEWLRTNSYAAASRELTPAIDLGEAAELYALRADARQGLGDYLGTEADCTRAIGLAEKGIMQLPANRQVLPAHWRYKRAQARRLHGDLTGAAEDFRAAIPQLGTGNLINQSHAALWLHLVRCEAGAGAAAAAELAAVKKSGWWDSDRQFARFLLGEISAAQLDAFAAANRNEDILFRTSFYIAMLRRVAGDSAGALARFHQADKHGTYDDFAKAEVRRALMQAARGAGESKLGAGDCAGALKDFNQALFLSEPDPADLLILFADAKRGLGDLKGALAVYRNVLKNLPAAEATTPFYQALEEKIAAVTQALEPPGAGARRPLPPPKPVRH